MKWKQNIFIKTGFFAKHLGITLWLQLRLVDLVFICNYEEALKLQYTDSTEYIWKSSLCSVGVVLHAALKQFFRGIEITYEQNDKADYYEC